VRTYIGPLERLAVGCSLSGNDLVLSYDDNGGGRREVRVTYPFALTDLPDQLVAGVALGGAVYLGSLSLAQTIFLDFPVREAMVSAIAPLAEMLYDVRRWKDGLPLADPPRLEYRDMPLSTLAKDLDAERALLLFSGGKDSCLSALLLQDNGYSTTALHIPCNEGVEELESRAVTSLAGSLDLSLLRLGYHHADFLRFSDAYATEAGWDSFPLCNRVPFGRDLLLALLAVPIAWWYEIGNVSMGHDNECRNAYFTYGGKSVPRNDVESTRGATVLQAYIATYLAPGLRLLPPVAALSELRILHEMLVGHPEAMSRTSSCFWGGNCGRCAKCLRYYLAQRVFNVEVLSFHVNPLSAGACPEVDDLLDLDASGALFQRQVLYCMSRLVERGDVRPGEERLMDFAGGLHHVVLPHLDGWAEDLYAVRSDPQLPEGFRYQLADLDGRTAP
jgi:7-cyano-7-deazaguanine synthase in queuosine biosynthesis